MSKERIVITGIGVISPFGDGVVPFWDALIHGKNGIGKVSLFDASELNCQVAAECKDFDATKYMDHKEVKRSDRYTHFAVAAAKLAMQDAGLNESNLIPERFGVLIGSGVGGMDTIETQARAFIERGPRRVSPFMIPNLLANMSSGVVAIALGAKGVNFSVVSACATGTHAIGEALLHLQAGREDVILAGGSEAAVTPLAFAGFCAMKAMATNFNDEPQRASRPFDADRCGFVMGEGAGVIALERYDHAVARGAHIYCEISGYGATCDAYHITSPDIEGRGLSQCLARTLEDANLNPEDVDYINAHGTSTPYNDKFETAAIHKVFGGHAKKLMVSSTKSMTGHMLGAAGAIEAAVCAKTIETGIVPPTINYEHPDPDCDLDYVPNIARESPVKVAISTNLGFGGHNGALLFKKM
ncbi:3-oxoacyl-[acyl-carrier-protein] synthase 2 [Coraliomargarita sp. CAG:312]|nr:3-oxoacyl-[acyl-carrier-protein] synthase 2 [Coraliomargarita sp. CAG:312]